MSESTVSPTVSKRTVFNHVLLFNITKSVVTRMLDGAVTSKTDKIIMSSLLKAVKKHEEEKQA